MIETKQPPARVAALAAKIGDAPLDWKEYEDGKVVIVFCNKGKQTFAPEIADEAPPRPVIHTKTEAEEVVKTLTPKPKKGE